MGRILASLILLLIFPVSGRALELGDGHRFDIGIEFGYLQMSGLPSWTEGSVGKLRYQDDGLVFNRAFIEYQGRLSDTLTTHISAEAYDDGVGLPIDVTESYLEWRPVPTSEARYRLKVGMFYPRISLENVDAGWSNRYTLNNSAINTWVAEELRFTGAELAVSRRPTIFGGSHTFSLSVTAFVGNDPAGSLLAWKGWSLHDRQTRVGDNLPLPPLPQIQDGMLFAAQDPYVEPIQEIDGDIGYSVNVEWRMGRKLLVRATHYDNRADPTVLDQGQYGWDTRFNHLGLQTTLPAGIGLVAQWMSGSTAMGGVVNGVHMVDVEYDAYFALLTRKFEDQRVSIRYDNFNVTQNDTTIEDNNSEEGSAWTVGYRYKITDKLSLGAEWLQIKTHRCGWAYYGLSPTRTERQTQVTLMARF